MSWRDHGLEFWLVVNDVVATHDRVPEEVAESALYNYLTRLVDRA